MSGLVEIGMSSFGTCSLGSPSTGRSGGGDADIEPAGPRSTGGIAASRGWVGEFCPRGGAGGTQRAAVPAIATPAGVGWGQSSHPRAPGLALEPSGIAAPARTRDGAGPRAGISRLRTDALGGAPVEGPRDRGAQRVYAPSLDDRGGIVEAPRRRGARHRKARLRRAACGELIQWDSSKHAWFENRAAGRQVLIQMHDDATNRLMVARFVPRDDGAANRQLAIDYLRRRTRRATSASRPARSLISPSRSATPSIPSRSSAAPCVSSTSS